MTTPPALVRDLIHFEEVEEVIKLRREERAREYVETYVISESLRSNLLYMLRMLAGAGHKSFNVVGNYGTGKSHFLAFVAALLEHPEYRSAVRDVAVRQAALGMERRYKVIKFELGAAAEVPLRYIFFDQVRRQLLDRYDIEVREIDLAAAYDNKQNMLDILADIKAADPEAGLVVIVDEISDFLKQKGREAMSYDIALLRELGEVSQDSDFLYIGAMQEHVFTNPKYVDQAESIARVNQRFVTVTITKEDVAQVLTDRVVRKDADQALRLRGLLADHRAYFPNLADQTDRYVALFPIHPYVIDVFERLPYFENRGIIGFTVQNVEPILDRPAPTFVTYDRVYDLINATHEVRNQPNVARVVKAVQTLESKADLLDRRYRDDAHKLIKALAVLRLLGGDHGLGATSQDLANTLFILPPGRLLVEPNMARDHIERVMKNLRDVTVGQFIDYQEGRYSLNPEKIEDYDALIEQRARAAVLGHEEEIERTFREIAAAELGTATTPSLFPGKAVYPDTAPWPSRNAYRPGLLIIGRADDAANLSIGDYRFVLVGPVAGKPLNRQEEVILGLEFGDELIGLLVRARAAGMLAQEKVYPKVMARLAKDAQDAFREKYLARLLSDGTVLHGGHKTAVRELPARRALDTLADVVEHIKGAALDAAFAERYPNHPSFRSLVTAANIESEVTRALQSLDRQATQSLDFNSRGYLESFGMLSEGRFSASSSPACQLALQRVEENDAAARLTPVEDLVQQFAGQPWGLPEPMVYLLLGSLLFNGYLVFVRQGGARLHAGDISPLLKSGLGFFREIRYIERDRDINVEAVAALFETLGLQAGLVRDKESRPEAVKQLRVRGGELRSLANQARQGMSTLIAEAGGYPGVPWLAIQALSSRLTWLDAPLATFAEASRVGDLGKLNVASEYRQTLQARLADLETLRGCLADWGEGGLGTGLRRLQQALAVLPRLDPLAGEAERTAIAALQRIAADSQAITSDEGQLLRADLRRPLKGKLEQFRREYDALYYAMHRRLAGDDAAWGDLATLRSRPRFQALNQLKGLPFISPAEFNGVALQMQALERRRCREFNAQTLESFVACPYCRFPDEGAPLADLRGRAEGLRGKLEALWQAWQSQVMAELPALAGRLPLLTPAHRAQIEGLIQAGGLPDSIPAELLEALYELSSELQPVELDLNDLAASLSAQGNALTVDGLRAGIERYLADLLKGRDRDLVRIKVIADGGAAAYATG